jgi:hypothetical protein
MYFQLDSAHFANFVPLGMSADIIASEIDVLYNSKSAEIHNSSMLATDEFIVYARQGLSSQQLKIMDVVIDQANWRVTIKSQVIISIFNLRKEPEIPKKAETLEKAEEAHDNGNKGISTINIFT